MRKLLTLLALATLPAIAQELPDALRTQQMNCRLDAKAENGTGISCTGIAWPPRAKPSQPPSNVANVKGVVKHPSASDGQTSRPYRNAAGRLCVQEKGEERCLGDPEIPRVRFREVADQKFWATVAVDAGMAAYAVEGIQHCRRVDPTCREANPVLGRTRGQQYAAKIGLTVLVPAIGKYYWRKWDMEDNQLGYNNHTPGWWLPAIISPVANFVDGTFAWRHQGRK
jgi:hypothetical protein